MAATNKLTADGTVIGIIDPKEIGPAMPENLDDDQKRLRALIERRHPKYTEMAEHWDFLEDTYEGGRDWFEDHIFQYVKEGEKEFKERKKRAYRFNHTREVVDLLDKYLFRMPVARNMEDAPQELRDFWNRCTRNGLGIDDFSRQLSRRSSMQGRIGVVVDSNMTGQPTSLAESRRLGSGVYAYTVGPRQLLDYSFDDAGELNWVLIEEYYRDDEDPFGENKDSETRWRLWTKQDWFLFEERGSGRKKKIVVADKGHHGLGRTPVILHDHVISDEEWCSPALIDDIAYLDRAVANYLSNLDAIIQDQTFSQLAMPAQGLMPGEENYNKMLEIGTKRVFLFDGEAGMPPVYISPDVKQAQLIVGAISKIINEIYHTVGLAGERTKEDNSVGIDNSSGVAKAYDFERVNSLLAAKASSLEFTEHKINELVMLWHGKKLEEKLVQYPKNFDTRGLYDEFDIAARLILVEAPDSVRRNQMDMVVTKLFPMAPKAQLKQIQTELKKWPPDPPVEPAPGGAPKGKSRQGQVTKTTK